MDNVKDALTKLREDFGDLYDAAMDMGRHAPGEMHDKLNAGLKQLKQLSGKAKARGAAAIETVEDQVAAHPLASVLIMFGVGALVAAFLRRK